MTIESWIAAIISIGVLMYLVSSLLRPERF